MFSSTKKLACGILLAFLTLSSGFAADTTRISASTAGAQGNKDSNNSAISANGRFVAFSSNSDNLVAGDTNRVSDVFVRDRVTNATTRVSIRAGAVQADGGSSDVAMSADGNIIAFVSDATNLVAGDTNKQSDVFIRNRKTNGTLRVSVSSTGVQGDNTNITPALSSDGRFVAFVSYATNLVAGDTNNVPDIFVYDRLTKKTTRVSVSSSGAEGNGESYNPALSADGRYVAFASEAANLVSGDTNAKSDIFIHDRQTKQTTRVSLNTNSAQGNDGSFLPAVSADGRFVAFDSYASNLVSGDTNGQSDVFVRDRQTNQTTRVSLDSTGVQGNKASEFPSISSDGRYVVFNSEASNLVSGDTNFFYDAFFHDRQTKQTTRLSLSKSNVQGNLLSSASGVSSEGRYVAFNSNASNIVTGDSNGWKDIFVRDRNLTNNFNADIALAATQQPASIAKNSQGSFVYTITNNGPATLPSFRIVYLVSNGQVVTLTPQTGACTSYSNISLCQIQNLASGASVTLTATVKALINQLGQQVSVISNGYADSNMANNYLDISTTVTP